MLQGTHHFFLVLLSVLIAIAASYTAIDLAARVRSATGAGRFGWLTLAAFAMGGGVWAMHFIAMLAFVLPGAEIRYALGETAISFLVPILGTGAALALMVRFGTGGVVLGIAGAMIGLSIAVMHYLGMHGIRGAVVIHQSVWPVVASTVVAIVAATFALRLSVADTSVRRRIAAAIVMGFAVAGMHFTAMSGTRFALAEGAGISGAFDQIAVALAVAFVAVLVLTLALIAAHVDRRRAHIAGSEADALKESELRFRMLVDGVTDYAIFMLDPHGYVTNWNSGAQRSKGYRAEEIVGRHFSTFYTEEEKALGLPQQALETAETEGKYEAEGWRVRKDGSRYWAHVVIDAIHDEAGRLVGFAKITRDVTERREAQRKLDETRQQLIHSQKLETIGQLTGGVAHDFNNLLAVVIGNLELLKKRIPDDPKLARLVETALKGAHRGASLTSRMLSFARKQDLKPEAIDVPKLVADTTDLLQRSLGPKVRIETHFPLHLSAAHVDGNQFELALVNLAVNARDAMPDGGVLTLSARDATIAPDDPRAAPEVLAHGGLAPGPYVVVSVSDTGVGMDAETLSRAVEPFFTTKGIGKGTGLGLSMVHGLAAQSGGGLVLKSTPGKGTTVEIWLPVDSSRAEVGPDSQAGAGRDPAAPLDILVVDDDALVLMATAALIEDLGHRVTEAYSASEALSVLRGGRRFDLVLTDEAMPGMTGSALARRIREEWPRLPVVIGTGYAEPPDTLDQRLPRISKPFDQRTLAQTFETVVGRTMGARPAPAPSRADRPVSAPIGSG
ncbi:MHYT domain-containing protein [Methyloraptor flagellatus]|uniref:histidine kinase n=1 Tax=Methyloraptor flagellatus TaxID=3162530 RepID=A0AAU7X6S5_9HYPH